VNCLEIKQKYHYVDALKNTMLFLKLCSSSSDGLTLMTDELSGLISELRFGVLHVSGSALPEIRDPPLGTHTSTHS